MVMSCVHEEEKEPNWFCLERKKEMAWRRNGNGQWFWEDVVVLASVEKMAGASGD